jgi:hypothetical protein
VVLYYNSQTTLLVPEQQIVTRAKFRRIQNDEWVGACRPQAVSHASLRQQANPLLAYEREHEENVV